MFWTCKIDLQNASDLIRFSFSINRRLLALFIVNESESGAGIIMYETTIFTVRHAHIWSHEVIIVWCNMIITGLQCKWHNFAFCVSGQRREGCDF